MAVNIASSMFLSSISPVPGPSGLQRPNSGTSFTELSIGRPDSAPSTPAGLFHKQRLSSTPNNINKRVRCSNDSSSMALHLEQSANSFVFPDDVIEVMAAAEEGEALHQAADGDLDNAERSDDRAALTSRLAGLDPATRAVVQAVINDQLTKMATLVEQKVKKGVNAKVAQLQQAAKHNTPRRLKVPSQVSVSIFISTIATHPLIGAILKTSCSCLTNQTRHVRFSFELQ